MARHVDIVKNDPRGQVVVARVEGDALRFAYDLGGYETYLAPNVADSRRAADPLVAFMRSVQGTHVFATDVHDDATCPVGAVPARPGR